jgi:hypothetical protein
MREYEALRKVWEDHMHCFSPHALKPREKPAAADWRLQQQRFRAFLGGATAVRQRR